MSIPAWINVLCPECKARLIKLFAGKVVRVPHSDPTPTAQRRALMRQALDEGISYRQIADTLQCSQSTVAAAGKRED